MSDSDFLDYIKERITRYESYYKILGLNCKCITDEEVKFAYEEKCKKLERMFKDCGEEFQEVKELIQTSLNDAYTALKTENSRNNYNELLKKINSSNESREADKEI